MALTKAPRRWIASLLAAVLVCLQLATAAYACATPGKPSQPVAAMSDMPDCPGMTALDDQSPPLCKAHCERDKQSVNTTPSLDLTPTLGVDWLLSRLLVSRPGAASGAQVLPAVRAAHTGPPPGAPPVYLAFLVLRH
jgi:hypothetical protein